MTLPGYQDEIRTGIYSGDPTVLPLNQSIIIKWPISMTHELNHQLLDQSSEKQKTVDKQKLSEQCMLALYHASYEGKGPNVVHNPGN